MDEFWANAIWSLEPSTTNGTWRPATSARTLTHYGRSLAPTVLIGLIFWFVMRAVIRADRGERKAYARIEAEERAKLNRERPVG